MALDNQVMQVALYLIIGQNFLTLCADALILISVKVIVRGVHVSDKVSDTKFHDSSGY